MTELATPAQGSFLDDLDTIDRDELEATSRDLAIGAGAALFSEGDSAEDMYVIRSGRLRVFRKDAEGREIELTQLGAGEQIGEVALLEGGTRTASAVAVEPSTLMVIDHAAFIDLLGRTPAVATRILAVLSRMIRDRTERLVRDEALRRQIELEAEVDRHRTLGQMVAGVAHELNTPLGTANTAADIIAKRLASESLSGIGADDRAVRLAIEDMTEAAGLLQRNLARAHGLVLSFKQISVQQSTATVETLDLGRVVADTVDLFRIDARLAGITVSVNDRRSDPSAQWTGQAGHLTQVLLNLLGNIQRYAYADGAGGPAEIVLTDAAIGDRPACSIVVRDHGRGIPPEDLGHVFEPFFTTGRGRGGSGLGMAIVRSLVTDALGGTVDIESQVGSGTTVTVVVPMQPVPPPDQPMP